MFDPESQVQSIELGIGTNEHGFQLLAPQKVGIESSSTLFRALQHHMNVFAVAVVTNKAGLRSTFRSEALLIDWTPPVITNLTSDMVDQGDGSYHVTAEWDVSDDETSVTGCYWHIGNGLRGCFEIACL